MDKASYANALAVRIMEQLLRSAPDKVIDGIDIVALYLQSLSVGIDVTPATHVTGCTFSRCTELTLSSFLEVTNFKISI
jgi:hypothetical protein